MVRSESQKKADKRYEEKREARSKVWACVMYPESAPGDWLEKLGETMVEAFVSPLHDKDVNPDGTPKKPHWHVLMSFGSLKTAAQVAEVMKEFGCTLSPERVKNTRGYARYLCHMDNPEKAQYNPSDIKSFGGWDYLSIIGLPSDKYMLLGEMMDYCDENEIYSYRLLLRFARKEREDWFRCLCDEGTYVMKEYLKSAAWEDGYRTYEVERMRRTDNSKEVRPQSEDSEE